LPEARLGRQGRGKPAGRPRRRARPDRCAVVRGRRRVLRGARARPRLTAATAPTLAMPPGGEYNRLFRFAEGGAVLTRFVCVIADHRWDLHNTKTRGEWRICSRCGKE